MTKHKFNSRAEVEAAVLHRAGEDPAFRKALLADPAKAIATAIGFELPAGMKLNVVEESTRQAYLVLPALAHGEMNADELDRVAGGSRAPKASGIKSENVWGDPHAQLPGGQNVGGQTGGG